VFRLTVDERRQVPVTVIPSTRQHETLYEDPLK